MLIVLLDTFNVDFRVADQLYHLQHDSWSLKDNFITQQLIHQGGRDLSAVLGVVTLAGIVLSHCRRELASWRRPMTYLFASAALSMLGVSFLKHTISMECPWDLARYGGSAPFIGLFEPRPPAMSDTACFPAGHASAGYAWIALYFFFAATWARWRWAGLGVGLAMGLTFGVAQQLRGAHFLSHDLWTLMVCWTTSFALAHLMLPSRSRHLPAFPFGAISS
ncbi:phosphatase PAP2 family protein [Halomonas shantousis]